MSDTFTHNGREYRIEIHQDDFGHPWKEHDGHGIVRQSRTRHSEQSSDKRPSERPLNDPDRRELQFYYDWKASLALALRDGWSCTSSRRPDESRKAYALRAVQQDFDYLRRYLAGDIVWQWIKVTSQSGESETLGGILDEWAGPHVMECARELAAQLELADNEAEQAARDELAKHHKAMRAALSALRPLEGAAALLTLEPLRYALRAAHKAACDAVAEIRNVRGEA